MGEEKEGRTGDPVLRDPCEAGQVIKEQTERTLVFEDVRDQTQYIKVIGWDVVSHS